MNIAFENEDLRAEVLAEGVWALMAKGTGGLVANCGLVDLGGTTVAWDAAATELGARSIRAAAIALTGRPPDLLLLSHPHADHFGGASALPESVYISSAGAREAVATSGASWLAEMKGDVAKGLTSVKAQIAAATDPAKQAELASWVPHFERALGGFAEQVRLPAVTVVDALTLHGSHRTAEFRVLGSGHSPADGVLFLPQDGLLFSGDLALPAGNLYLNVGGKEQTWPALLDRLLAIGAERLVPGHGPVSPVDQTVETSKAYLADLFAALEAGLASGEGPAWAETCPVPERWNEAAFRRNLKGQLQARLA